MLRNQTVNQMHALRLPAVAAAYERQLQEPEVEGLSFDERLGLLTDAEYRARENKRMARLLRDARLRLPASPEDMDFHTPRGLERGVVKSLFTCGWIERKQNVILSGPTGVGKTFLTCALGQAACRQGHRVRYARLSRLLDDLLVARGDGRYGSFLQQLARLDLLILDDWGLTPLTSAQGREVLEVLDDRADLRSTCVASQLPFELWHQQIPDPTIADAVLDRLLHKAHRLLLTGESMRAAIGQPLFEGIQS